jgi:hypothetical protein
MHFKYHECVSVFLPQVPGMQLAYFQHHIILASVAYLALLFCSHYFINGTIFEEMLWKIKYVF